MTRQELQRARGLNFPATRGVLLAMVLVSVPSVTFANAGTALMWAGCLYLFGGNVVLGVVEGLVLAKWFRLSVRRCIGWMIVGNVISAWVGQLMLAGVIMSPVLSGELNLYSIRDLLLLGPFAAWIATLLIEWPFTILCIVGNPGWMKKSLLATAVIQTVSSAVVILVFTMTSFIGLVTHHEAVPPEELPWPAGLMVFHFDSDGHTVRAFDTDTGESRILHTTSNPHRSLQSAVFFSKDPAIADTEIRMLVAGEFGRSHLHEHDVEELGVLVDTSHIHRVVGSWLRDDPERARTRFPFGVEWHPYTDGSVSIGPPPDELERFRQGFWAAEGLLYQYANSGAATRLSMETPHAMWAVRHSMLLEDGLVMFQLGDEQICLLDMKTRRVALKLRGFGPLAVPKSEIEEP